MVGHNQRRRRASILSLKRTSPEQGTSKPTTAKRNLLQRIVSRRSGRSPRNQNRRPSRLIIGKMKRVVNVDMSRPTTETFMKLTMLTQPEYWTV